MSNRLQPCPDSPNCVCSDEAERVHAIKALRLAGELTPAWQALVGLLEQDARVTVKQHADGYLRAEARTRLFRFVDDVEFQARPEAGVIAMRSASRLGYSDLGANRKRLETVRAALVAQGVISAN